MNQYEAKFDTKSACWGVFNNKSQTFFETGPYAESYAKQYADDLNDLIESKRKEMIDLVDWSY